MDNQSIQSIEIKLPVTGQTAVMYQYLTIGQSRELQRIIISEGNLDINKGTMENVNASAVFKMQDRAAELLIKEYIDIDGNRHPFSADWLNNLPIGDGTLVYNKVNELVGESNLSSEAKKN
jgi:hypothetical protein